MVLDAVSLLLTPLLHGGELVFVGALLSMRREREGGGGEKEGGGQGRERGGREEEGREEDKEGRKGGGRKGGREG